MRKYTRPIGRQKAAGTCLRAQRPKGKEAITSFVSIPACGSRMGWFFIISSPQTRSIGIAKSRLFRWIWQSNGSICGVLIISVLVFSLINTTYAKTEYEVAQDYYGKYQPGEIIVQFKAHASSQDVAALIEKQSAIEKSYNSTGNYVLLSIPVDKPVSEMAAIFNQSSLVEYAEPNYYAEGFGTPSALNPAPQATQPKGFETPNDLYFKYQWNLSSKAKGGVNILPAWKISAGYGVTVAILDTGAAYEDYAEYRLAPDLEDTSFVTGYDFVNKDEHPNDDNGHGTHIAGVIAQSTNNGIGVAGIAYQATLMPIKVMDKNNRGSYADIASGIYYALEHGASVINLSLGGVAPSVTLENALREAYHRGITIVAAAGNSCLLGNPVIYPAAYDEYVIAVGAVRYDGERAPYSNTGGYIDLVAPGGDTRKDQNYDGIRDGILQQTISGCPSKFSYYLYQGTSMATAHVSGVAALLLATSANHPQQVKEALTATARDRGRRGWDKEYGYGIIDAHAALTYKQRRLPDVAITSLQMPNVVKRGESVNINVTLQNLSYNTLSTTITLKEPGERFIIAEKKISLKATKIATFVWNTDGIPAGEHLVAAEIERVDGEVNLDNNSKSVRIIIEETQDSQKTSSISSQLLPLVSFQYVYYNGYKEALVLVQVEDERGQPVFGALVTLEWQYAGETYRENKETVPDDPAGGEADLRNPDSSIRAIAKFRSNPIPLNYGVSYEVVKVTKTGYAYIKAKSLSLSTPQKRLFTELLQNYPNPFNSDTWIPYKLAEESKVVISIFDLKGKPIRRIDLGYKQAGEYNTRYTTAYWDGRNDAGEKVASGLYFCTLQAGKFTDMRRLVIDK